MFKAWEWALQKIDRPYSPEVHSAMERSKYRSSYNERKKHKYHMKGILLKGRLPRAEITPGNRVQERLSFDSKFKDLFVKVSSSNTDLYVIFFKYLNNT